MSALDEEPKFIAALRDMAAHGLGVTLGREQLGELMTYLDELKEEAESLWNSCVEMSEQD